MCVIDVAFLLYYPFNKLLFFSKSSFMEPVNAGQVIGAPYVLKEYIKYYKDCALLTESSCMCGGERSSALST